MYTDKDSNPISEVTVLLDYYEKRYFSCIEYFLFCQIYEVWPLHGHFDNMML